MERKKKEEMREGEGKMMGLVLVSLSLTYEPVTFNYTVQI